MRALALFLAVVALGHVTKADLIPALSLPASGLLPNATGYAYAVEQAMASLALAVGDALEPSAAAMTAQFAPAGWTPCANGAKLRACGWGNRTACKDRCPGAHQICAPDVCGSCEPICYNLTVPAFKLPAAPKLPTISSVLPKLNATCGVDTAPRLSIRLNRTSVGGRLSWTCKACPKGTTTKAGALACTVCPPSTFSNHTSGECQRCKAGTYAKGFFTNACQPCKAGSFSAVAGSVICFDCPVGLRAGAAGATRCHFGFQAGR